MEIKELWLWVVTWVLYIFIPRCWLVATFWRRKQVKICILHDSKHSSTTRPPSMTLSSPSMTLSSHYTSFFHAFNHLSCTLTKIFIAYYLCPLLCYTWVQTHNLTLETNAMFQKLKKAGVSRTQRNEGARGGRWGRTRPRLALKVGLKVLVFLLRIV